MECKELLEAIIKDMNNSISDYQETISMVSDKLLKIVYKSRIDELKEWVYIFKHLLAEMD